MLAPIVIVGDSQACGAGQVAPALAGDHPIRVACKVGSHTIEWATKIAEVPIAPGDWVAVYLGSNDYDGHPDPRPIVVDLLARGANRIVWVGPPRIRDLDGPAPDFLASRIAAGGDPNVVFYDTRTLGLRLPDGIHPDASDHKRWFAGVIASLETGAPAAPTIPNVPGIDAPTWPKLVAAARAVGADPRDWAAVLLSESGFKPAIANNAHDKETGLLIMPVRHLAVGINQFSLVGDGTPGSDTFAIAVGKPSGLSADQYLALPASRQLDFVIPFWHEKYKKHPEASQSARDLYWLNILPTSYDRMRTILKGDPVPDDYEITRNPDITGPNVPLILPEDKASPVIRPRGIDVFLKNAQKADPARWKAILAAIDAAEKGPAGPDLPLPRNMPPLDEPRIAQASLAGPAVVLGLFGLWAWARRKRGRR